MITDASSSPIFYQEEGGIQSVWTTTPGEVVVLLYTNEFATLETSKNRKKNFQ